MLFIDFISNKYDDNNILSILDNRVLTSGFFMAYNLFQKSDRSLLCGYATTVAVHKKKNIADMRLIDYIEGGSLNNNSLQLPIFVYYASILKNGQKIYPINLSNKIISKNAKILFKTNLMKFQSEKA